MSYTFNTAAEKIGESLIKEFHPHLIDVGIAYITKESASESAKVPRGGKALKLGGAATLAEKYQLLALRDYEFVIEVNGAYWMRLTRDQQVALIDHELCHCRSDRDGFYTADHDVEEFRAILRRHGFWKPDIQAFCEEAQPLFGIRKAAAKPTETGDVVVCAGQVVRIEETGDLWAYNAKEQRFELLSKANAENVREATA